MVVFGEKILIGSTGGSMVILRRCSSMLRRHILYTSAMQCRYVVYAFMARPAAQQPVRQALCKC